MDSIRLEIDKELWLYDDPRIDGLYTGDLTVIEFMKQRKPEDPWVLSRVKSQDGGTVDHLMVIPVDQIETRNKQRLDNYRTYIRDSGGLRGRVVYEHGERIQEVYPELKNTLAELRETISRKKCKGCALNKEAEPLLTDLLSLDPAGRDIDSLSDILPDTAIKRLKAGRPLTDEEIADVPDPVLTAKPVLRSQPREGEPNVVNDMPARRQAVGKKGSSAPRAACLDCTRKHIAKAVVLLEEYLLGYPEHRWLAIGNLSEAEAEILGRSRLIAEQLRVERLRIQENRSYIPDLVPFIRMVTELEEQGLDDEYEHYTVAGYR